MTAAGPGTPPGSGTQTNLGGVRPSLVGAQRRAVATGQARRRPWRPRCGGCRHTPGRGFPARRRARVPLSVTGTAVPFGRAQVRTRSVSDRAHGVLRVAQASGLVGGRSARRRRPRPRPRPRRGGPRRAPRARCRPRPRPPRARPRGPRSDTCAVTLTTSASGSVTRVEPSGSSTWPARTCVPASAPSTETVMLSGMCGRLDLELQARVVGRDDGLGAPRPRGGPGRRRRPSRPADDDQVDVLDDRLDRVALDVLREGQLLVAVEDDREEGVALLQRQHGVVTGQGDVDGGGAVAVHDGGDLVVAADLAGRTLAELGAGLGDELVVGHGCSWDVESGSGSRSSTRDVAPNDRRANGPRIHRICVPPASITDASTARGGQTGQLWPVRRPSPRQPPESRATGEGTSKSGLAAAATPRVVALTQPDGDDPGEQHHATQELDGARQLVEEEPREEHREEHLGEADERREGRAEVAGSEDAEDVGQRRGDEHQLEERQPGRDTRPRRRRPTAPRPPSAGCRRARRARARAHRR